MKKVVLGRYPYGKSSAVYKKAKKWLKANGTNGYEVFDYPEYAGMPLYIAHGLWPEEVDYIQSCWPIAF